MKMMEGGVKIPMRVFSRERRGSHTHKNKKSNGVLPRQGIEVKENGQRRDYARRRKGRFRQEVQSPDVKDRQRACGNGH